jgi:hypothetical protein
VFLIALIFFGSADNKETMLIVDASPVGLAALLIQEGKIIAYSSRALTDVESRLYFTLKLYCYNRNLISQLLAGVFVLGLLNIVSRGR